MNLVENKENDELSLYLPQINDITLKAVTESTF